MRRRLTRVSGLVALLLAAPALSADDGAIAPPPWFVPPPGACAPQGGLRGWPPGRDAPPLPFQPGDSFTHDKLPALEAYLPKDVWAFRDRFFYEGMQLEIGPCFADYSPPAFFQEATEKFAGKAQLVGNGGLANYTAGLPFAPDQLSPDDPDAGAMWAWNVEQRYQAAGFRGPFRTSDMVGRAGRAEPFEGEIFKVNLSFRADLADQGYAEKGARGRHWIAGGMLKTPFSARDYTWRQFRSGEHMVEPDRSDDLHAYLPEWRRVRRLPSISVEGIYMPSFSVGVQQPQTAAGSGSAMAPGAQLAIGAASAAATTITTKRSGFEGLETRPLLYDYRVLGMQDVLAPINAKRPSYPVEDEREFGPWGLSFASDTWDLRRALVLEGRARGSLSDSEVERVLYYVDLQTLQPLYYVSHRYRMDQDAREGYIDVGMYVGRFSEDRPDYPRWPDDPDRPIRVIDPVGAAFANIAEDGGWRRESWTMVSTPPSPRELKRLLSVNELSKRR